MGSTFSYTTLCFVALTIISFVVAASAEEFKVGDTVGWREPSVNETDLYNHWASNKKFHIGDSLRKPLIISRLYYFVSYPMYVACMVMKFFTVFGLYLKMLSFAGQL